MADNYQRTLAYLGFIQGGHRVSRFGDRSPPGGPAEKPQYAVLGDKVPQIEAEVLCECVH